jgi:hypothetical protein
MLEAIIVQPLDEPNREKEFPQKIASSLFKIIFEQYNYSFKLLTFAEVKGYAFYCFQPIKQENENPFQC